MPRTRDYRREYQRRLALGRERGLSVSQARGHARTKLGERKVSEIKREARTESVPIREIPKTVPLQTGNIRRFDKAKTVHTNHGTICCDEDIEDIISEIRRGAFGIYGLIPSPDEPDKYYQSKTISLRGRSSSNIAGQLCEENRKVRAKYKARNQRNPDDEPDDDIDDDEPVCFEVVTVARFQ